MAKKGLLRLLKVIGVILFIWIIAKIDRAALRDVFAASDTSLILVSFLILVLGMYAAKALRWHILVRTSGLAPSFYDSWKLFHIGIFLGSITPSNLGEFGRVAYLRQKGLHGATGTAIVLLDRLADVGFMGLVGLYGIWKLFGSAMLYSAVTAACIGVIALMIAWRTSKALRQKLPWLQFLETLSKPGPLLGYIATTVLAWSIYFVWTIMLARAVGIDTAIPVMISALTLTGIVSLLPISPSGLGTRDATLLFLLTPFGVTAAQAVALSSLMFILILASGLPGLSYWLRPEKQ